MYAGQCNCAYWCGVFGRLYLPHLRNAVYNMLLKAEIYAKVAWNIFDFNCDSAEECLYESKTQSIYVSQKDGGSIFELDIFKIHHNLLEVLTRRYGLCHKKLRENIHNVMLASDDESEAQTIHSDAIRVKETNLDKYLGYDNCRRASLIDHFFANGIKHDDYLFNNCEEKGDFATGLYNAKLEHTRQLPRSKFLLFHQKQDMILEI